MSKKAFDSYSPTVRRLFEEGQTFLIEEADLLDTGKYDEWLGRLTEDIRYQIPLRITRERHAASPFSDHSWHMNDNLRSITMRVERTFTDYNWAEDPPSRTRHFLTNYRLTSFDQKEARVEIVIELNLLVFRSRFDSPSYDLISGKRVDTLRKTDDGWKLAKRLVLLDHTTMGISSLGIFL